MLTILRMDRFRRGQPHSFMRKAGRLSGGRLLNHNSHFSHGIGARDGTSIAVSNVNHSSLKMPQSAFHFTTPRLKEERVPPHPNADLPDAVRTAWQDAARSYCRISETTRCSWWRSRQNETPTVVCITVAKENQQGHSRGEFGNASTTKPA